MENQIPRLGYRECYPAEAEMNSTDQVLTAIKMTYSPISSDELDRIVRDNESLCQHLAAALSEFEGETIKLLCPVLVDRKDRIGFLQRILESPFSSCGWLVATNKRLIYTGIVRRPTMHPWGGVSCWSQSPDNQQFQFERIQSAKAIEGKAGFSFEVQSEDTERLITTADAGFANQLQSIAGYVNQQIAG